MVAGPGELAARAPSVRDVLGRGRARAALALLGPAFVAAVAYVDPGNIATTLVAGTEHGYALVWVVVAANLMAVLVQYLTSKAGLATGANLAELCRERFSRRVTVMLWIQAEAVAMATDLAEFVGAALGLYLVFGVPLLPAGGLVAIASFGILALQGRGHRPFEVAIVALLAVVGVCFVVLLARTGLQPGPFARGWVPHLTGSTATLAVGIVGATVMPHVVYLHSALHQRRLRVDGTAERRVLLRADRWDCVLGLGVAGGVNLAMLCVAAGLAHRSGVTGLVDIGAGYQRLGSVLGGGAALLFGVALMASGLSSASVGTYAGQVVMAGFLRWRVPLMLRRALTMAPALLVLAVSSDVTEVLVLSQVALSFGIPFALIPLTWFTTRRDLMGDMVNRRRTTVAMIAVTAMVSALNVALLVGTVRGFG